MGLLASSLVNKLQTWPEYLRRITGGLPPADIARRSGIPLSTITRWLAGETKPSPAKINVLAAHFPLDRDEAHRVVAAYSTSPRPQENAQIFQVGGGAATRKTLLRMYSDLELATEIVRRIEEHDSVEFAVPFDHEVHGAETNITPLRPNVLAPEETHLPRVAKKKSRDRGGDDGQG